MQAWQRSAAPCHAMRGMALVAVLWIVAALSVMVTGLTMTTRAQISTVAVQRDAATGQALGDAAIHLVLQALMAGNSRPDRVESVTVPYLGVDIHVEVAPLNGLISLNGGDAPLLAALLQHAGGLAPSAAEAMARQLVEWREGAPAVDPTSAAAADVGQPRRFEAIEDLMLVPGVGYALYSRIAPLVSADLRGGSQVNPLAAPAAVLAVLAPGNPDRIQAFVTQRASGQPGGDSSFLDGNVVARGGGGTDLYRLSASVPLEAGKILLLTRDVSLRGGSSSVVPWRQLHQSRQIVSAGAS